MNIECEMRFYFPNNRSETLRAKLKQFVYEGRYHEITTMYDNPNPDYTFYNSSIDGRLRIRMAKEMDATKENRYGLVSWKQRMPAFKGESIRHEHEIEFHFNYTEAPAIKEIFEHVLNCPRISSYERYRNHYKSDELHITLDEFPFGLMLEFEIATDSDDVKKYLLKILDQFGLEKKDASSYSCDDMYKELCLKKDKSPKPDILFDDQDMPLL